jgi:hypothetical protein
MINGWKNTYYYQPYWWDKYYVEWGISTGIVSYLLVVYADSFITETENNNSIPMSSYYYYSLISTAVTA